MPGMPRVAIESRKHAASRPRPPLPSPGSASTSISASKSTPSSVQACRGVVQVGWQQRVHQRAAREVFHRQVVHALGVLVAGMLDGFAPALDDPIAHGVEDGEHPVALRGRFQVLAHGVGQPFEDRMAQGVHRVGGEGLFGKVDGCGHGGDFDAIKAPHGAGANGTARRTARRARASRSAAAWRSAGFAAMPAAAPSGRTPAAVPRAGPAC